MAHSHFSLIGMYHQSAYIVYCCNRYMPTQSSLHHYNLVSYKRATLSVLLISASKCQTFLVLLCSLMIIDIRSRLNIQYIFPLYYLKSDAVTLIAGCVVVSAQAVSTPQLPMPMPVNTMTKASMRVRICFVRFLFVFLILFLIVLSFVFRFGIVRYDCLPFPCDNLCKHSFVCSEQIYWCMAASVAADAPCSASAACCSRICLRYSL